MNAKLKKLTVIGALLATGTLGATAIAQGGPGFGPGYGGGPGYGPGMMGGYGPGMMGGYGPGRGMGPGYGRGFGPGGGAMHESLNLSEEQREKIQAIREENRQKNWATMGQVRTEMFKLRRMESADNADTNAVVEQQKKVDELRRQMLASRLEARKQVEVLLTPEQRKQFRQYRPWWMQDNEG